MLIRNTLTPASSNAFNVSEFSVAGPKVAMILVLRGNEALAGSFDGTRRERPQATASLIELTPWRIGGVEVGRSGRISRVMEVLDARFAKASLRSEGCGSVLSRFFTIACSKQGQCRGGTSGFNMHACRELKNPFAAAACTDRAVPVVKLLRKVRAACAEPQACLQGCNSFYG